MFETTIGMMTVLGAVILPILAYSAFGVMGFVIVFGIISLILMFIGKTYDKKQKNNPIGLLLKIAGVIGLMATVLYMYAYIISVSGFNF